MNNQAKNLDSKRMDVSNVKRYYSKKGQDIPQEIKCLIAEDERAIEAAYIKGSKLEWSDLWEHLGMKKDSGGRWYPSSATPQKVADYIDGNFRSPSRAWPNSYATACMTQKFAKFLTLECPDLAIKIGVAV